MKKSKREQVKLNLVVYLNKPGIYKNIISTCNQDEKNTIN